MKFSSLSVIGLGYIGLPTAAVFTFRKIIAFKELEYKDGLLVHIKG